MALINWYNRWEEPLGSLDVISATHSESLDGEDLLEVTCANSEVSKGDRMLWSSIDGTWHEHVVDSIVNKRNSGYPVTELKCISSMAYDLANQLVPDSNITSHLASCSVEEAVYYTLRLYKYIRPNGLRWSVGETASGTVKIKREPNGCFIDRLSPLREVAEYGYEMYPTITLTNSAVSSRKVNMVENRGDQNAFWRFQWGCNADAIRRSVLTHDPVSRLYVYGQADSETGRRISLADFDTGYITPEGTPAPYIESDAALNEWGLTGTDGTKIPTEAIVIFDEVKQPSVLYYHAVKAWYAMRNLKVSYDIDSVSLSSDDPQAIASLGDTVQIVDSGMKPELRITGRISRISRNLITGEASATIGADSKNISNKFMLMQSKGDSLDRRLSYLESR